MLHWLRARSDIGKTAAALYGSIVTQARSASFYAAAGVPDTMEGRFGMIGVHMFLALERIRLEGDSSQRLGRALLEAAMTDIDDSLREIGVSDLGVPRRVKKAAAALMEQLDAYRAATAGPSPRDDLARHLAHHVYLDRGGGAPAAVADYMIAAAPALAAQPWSAIAEGTIAFPAFDYRSPT